MQNIAICETVLFLVDKSKYYYTGMNSAIFAFAICLLFALSNSLLSPKSRYSFKKSLVLAGAKNDRSNNGGVLGVLATLCFTLNVPVVLANDDKYINSLASVLECQTVMFASHSAR